MQFKNVLVLLSQQNRGTSKYIIGLWRSKHECCQQGQRRTVVPTLF